jgi:hypothetical protein
LSVTSAANRSATPDHGCATITGGASTNDGGTAIANGSARSNATGTVYAARADYCACFQSAEGDEASDEAQHDDDALHFAPFHVLIFFNWNAPQ